MIHLLLDTYLLSYSYLLVFNARISLRDDFFVRTLLLPELKIPKRQITTNIIWIIGYMDWPY